MMAMSRQQITERLQKWLIVHSTLSHTERDALLKSLSLSNVNLFEQKILWRRLRTLYYERNASREREILFTRRNDSYTSTWLEVAIDETLMIKVNPKLDAERINYLRARIEKVAVAWKKCNERLTQTIESVEISLIKELNAKR